MSFRRERDWPWSAVLAVIGCACAVGFSFGHGAILSREACGAVSRERARFLSAINPTVRLTSAEWKTFGLSCLAGYSYETFSPEGSATHEFVVVDLQSGHPVFLHRTRLVLMERPESKRKENTPQVGRVET